MVAKVITHCIVLALTFLLKLSVVMAQCPTYQRLGEARYPKPVQNHVGAFALANAQDSLLTPYEFDSVATYEATGLGLAPYAATAGEGRLDVCGFDGACGD
jgi:hypothetical protein